MKDFLKDFKGDCVVGTILLFLTFLLAVTIKGIALFILAVVHLNISAMALLCLSALAGYIVISFVFNILSFCLKKIYRLCKK